MKITNKYNLPEPVVTVKTGTYDPIGQFWQRPQFPSDCLSQMATNKN